MAMHANAGTRPPDAEQLTVSVLLAFGNEQPQLSRILKHSKWKVHTAECVEEALCYLRDNCFSIVICPYAVRGQFPWKQLETEISKLTPPPRLIVTNPHPEDALWAEVLNLGAYDVVTGPYEARSVFHVLACAWQSWHSEKTRDSVGHAA
jgi:DNA-binding NtrC family response regulator